MRGAVSATVLLQVDEVLDVLRAQGRAAIEIPEIDRTEAGEAQTLMILGSDIRYADREAGIPPRSDTILLVRLAPDKEVTCHKCGHVCTVEAAASAGLKSGAVKKLSDHRVVQDN